MISRYIYIFCLVLSLISLSIRAENETPGEEVDPALQAVQALGTENTETSPEEPAMPEEDQTGMETTTEAGTAAESGTGAEAATESESAMDTFANEQQEVTSDQEPGIPEKDVILVLDNSGSMKKNDPQFLLGQAVNEFISELDDKTRLAIIIFDQNVKIAVPLTLVNDESRTTILDSLQQINYAGQYTDSPAAIERAIYDLKTNGRKEAKKLIVFMTDGIVDTGNAEQDLEKARWLKQDLAAEAADEGIQIFGIAFTDNADFQLIQSLAQQTEGEYYRALQPEDLKNVFGRIHKIINRVPEPEPVAAPEPQPVAPPPPPPVAEPPPKPVIIQVPAQPQKMDEEEALRSKMILVALAVLIIAVIIMVLMLIRGSRRKKDEDEYVQEAFLNDIHSYTSQASYKLGKKPTMLGRVAGTDTEHLDYIVIPETTIGRRHALIEYKDFAYWIIDQGSINGTFVNDQMITSETRLKHGDLVRLHKFEFEFLMPEMADAGMTVISKTVLAAKPELAGDEETIARGSAVRSDSNFMPEPDFDLTGGMDTSEEIDDEEDTVIKESVGSEDETYHREEYEDEEESSDETLMLDDDTAVSDEDATIRPDMVKDDD